MMPGSGELRVTVITGWLRVSPREAMTFVGAVTTSVVLHRPDVVGLLRVERGHARAMLPETVGELHLLVSITT